MDKEIGGYIELDRYTLPMLHEGALALNCGRSCLAYLIEQKNIKKLAVPSFLCDTVTAVIPESVSVRYYEIDDGLRPVVEPEDGEYVYVVNYYGQCPDVSFPDMIMDNAQAYFEMPRENTDTLYTCRKFFGVPDGAFLYTDAPFREYERDFSYQRMAHILGRFEKTGREFYADSAANNDYFDTCGIKAMSVLTENLLHAIDYDRVKRIRTENFRALHSVLGQSNMLDVHPVEGAFAYPYMTERAEEIRKTTELYIPTLWPNTRENKFTKYVLPLPVDQRYTEEDMYFIAESLK